MRKKIDLKISETYSNDLKKYALLIDMFYIMDQLPVENYYNEILDKIDIKFIERYIKEKKLKNINKSCN